MGKKRQLHQVLEALKRGRLKSLPKVGEQMNMEYGAQVVDKRGQVVGNVNYVMRNTWTGEIIKFKVRPKQPDKDLVLLPEDTLEVAKSSIRLSVSSEELGQKSEE